MKLTNFYQILIIFKMTIKMHFEKLHY